MKRLFVIVAALALLGAQAPRREDYPGQSRHDEPPKGWVCTTHPSASKSHKCDCHRTCSKDETGAVTVMEDAKCKVYCHKEHCTCPSGCTQT
jgi:hypothetical protein